MSKQWKPTHSLFLSRILVMAVFGLLIALLFCIPLITEWYDSVSGQEPIALVLNISLYLSDAAGFAAAFFLHRLLGNIRKQEIFVDANVTCLRVIAWCCFGLALIFFALGFWRSLAWMITFAAAFFGLIMRVLKNVFQLAVEMRKENDYTI